MRLGLTGASPPRANPGFRFERSLKGDMLPFDRAAPPPEAAAEAEPARVRGASEPYVPPKFALAGQKLTFKGYFQEGVPESALETSRKRHLVVLYYLEDDTVEIVEPVVRNNGLIPGRFLKRMKLPGFSPETLTVGAVVEVFSRALRLYACDEYTRVRFLLACCGARPVWRPPLRRAPCTRTARSPAPPSPAPPPPLSALCRSSTRTWARRSPRTRPWRRTPGPRGRRPTSPRTTPPPTTASSPPPSRASSRRRAGRKRRAARRT